MLSRKTRLDAATAWNFLRGVINVYKPPEMKVSHVRASLLTNLCKDLNSLTVREPIKRICIEQTSNHGYILNETASLADDVLAVGPRYLINDLKCGPAASLGYHTSGVLILGINNGLSTVVKLQQNRPIRVYHVKGCFGTSTETHFKDSRITCKATYGHIWDERISSLVSSLQASHQKKMFEICGVDIQSQAAYELACKGLIRPANNKIPVIYGIKLIHFKKPEFTLEIHAVNENENYLANLINDIAIELKSVAHCTGIRCVRHAHFTVEDSLLRRHWTLNGVFTNMNGCNQLLKDHPKMLRRKDAGLSSD